MSADPSSPPPTPRKGGSWGKAFDDLYAFQTRPEGLPGYFENEEGSLEVLPDEPWCRFRDTIGMYSDRAACKNKFTPGNIRFHIESHYQDDNGKPGKRVRTTKGGSTKATVKACIEDQYETLLKCVDDFLAAGSDERAQDRAIKRDIINPKGSRKETKVMEEEERPEHLVPISGYLNKDGRISTTKVKKLLGLPKNLRKCHAHEGECIHFDNFEDCEYLKAFKNDLEGEVGSEDESV